MTAAILFRLAKTGFPVVLRKMHAMQLQVAYSSICSAGYLMLPLSRQLGGIFETVCRSGVRRCPALFFQLFHEGGDAGKGGFDMLDRVGIGDAGKALA